MVKIFISYSRVDIEAVKQFAELLGYGCDVWYDTGIVGGEDWWERIISEIDKCEFYIYLLSRDSIESEYCEKELNYALENRKHIIPVRIRDRTRIPDEISHLQLINTFGDKMTDGMSRIYGAILKTSSKDLIDRYNPLHHMADRNLLERYLPLLEQISINNLLFALDVFYEEDWKRENEYASSWRTNILRLTSLQQKSNSRFFDVKINTYLSIIIQSLEGLFEQVPKITDIDKFRIDYSNFENTYKDLKKYIKIQFPDFDFAEKV
ncbi:MAG: toll/interleukin-1 receptor domain-containing protein [Chloroflexota bacterium]